MTKDAQTKKEKKQKKLKRRRRLLLFSKEKERPSFISLKIKFTAVLIISAVVVITLALILIPMAVTLITNYYMEPHRIDTRLDDYIQSFSDYVSDEKIASDNAAAVAHWSNRHRNVHLVVFGGDNAQLGVFDGEILEGDNLPEIEDPILTDNIEAGPTIGNTYMVRFSDRICTVSVMDYSGVAVYNGVHIVGILIAVTIYFLIVILYHHFQIKAILHLSDEVEAVSGGALSAPIMLRRNDEIGTLARSVDVMRTTILTKMEEEKATREANSELITSMSHDIRTPLTTLLGYMELLQNESDRLTTEQSTYVRLCSEKAEQIKELSDKLFLYFWAYNIREERVEVEPCDISLIGEQMLGDWLTPMEDEGFCLVMRNELPGGTSRILVNTECLRRIIDNLFDNIRKYAHKEDPVEVILSQKRRYEVCITFRNTICGQPNKTKGTHIGHKTCLNMAQLMSGRFETHTDGKTFEARLYLPIGHPTRK